MAKRSKTQRAKASAARQARKATREEAQEVSSEIAQDAQTAEDAQKKTLFGKKDTQATEQSKQGAKASDKKQQAEKKSAKPKKSRFQFFRDVQAEMKRVTWPTRQDVLRWSVVVICALIFFGVYVALLDNVVSTPLLVFISSLGA